MSERPTADQIKDIAFMERALALAAKPVQSPGANPRVGCVVVKDENIIAEGYHLKTGQAHAEVNALEQAKENGEEIKNATVYVTLEPCSHTGKTPPCADALIQAGVSRVVVAMTDPNPQVSGRGIAKLEEAGITVESGLLEQKAKDLNPGFIKRMQTGLPYLRLKLAMSIDGRIALENGESKWISSSQSRADVQKYRLKCNAILTSSETVIKDDPRLTIRANELAENIREQVGSHIIQPLRIVLDSHLKISKDSKILTDGGDTLVFHCDNQPSTDKNFISVPASKTDSEHLDIRSVFEWIGKNEINDVFVECGATLAGLLIQNQLIDELIIYQAPKLFGHQAIPLMRLPKLANMDNVTAFRLAACETIGDDVKLIYKPRKQEA